MAISLIGSKLGLDSILFIGWFGPRGLASIVLALLALEELKVFLGDNIFLSVVFVTVLISVFAHGLTASHYQTSMPEETIRLIKINDSKKFLKITLIET